MEQIYCRIKNLTLIPIEDKNKFLKYSDTCTQSFIICTPELRHFLTKIIHKCSIIKTASQFVPPEELSRKDKDYEIQIQYSAQCGQWMLDCLEYQLGYRNTSKQSDNEILSRIPEHVAKLERFDQQLEPLFKIAQQSIDSANDHFGITDRLLGYRTNLSRNGQCNYRQRYAFDLSESSRPEMAPRFNIQGWNTWKTETHKSIPAYKNSEEFKRWKDNRVERAGIEVNYPGQSETRSAFTKPPRPVTEVLDNHGKVVACKPGYRVCPNIDLEKLGYKLPKSADLEQPKSNYTISFQYPDAKQVNLCPWKRYEYEN